MAEPFNDDLIAAKSMFALVGLAAIIGGILLCLVPAFDGALFSQEWKDALWARFFMGAPARQRRSVERYNIVKRWSPDQGRFSAIKPSHQKDIPAIMFTSPASARPANLP